MTTFRPQESFGVRATGNINARLNKIYQAAAARMFYIWGEVSDRAWNCFFFRRKIIYTSFLSKALSSQLETILDKEQAQNTADANNEFGGGGGANFWNSDETYEDYYNEGRHAWSLVPHVVVVVIVFISLMSVFIYRYSLSFV